VTYDLLAVGEAMAEIRQSPDASFTVSYAGDTYNTAIYCSRCLPQSSSVAYMTRVGTDPLSLSFTTTAQREGLATDHIETDQNLNIGIYAVSTDDSGERSFSYWRKDSAARQLFSTGSISFPDSRILYLSGITLAILEQSVRNKLLDKLMEIKRSGSTLIAFDSNYRPALWESKEIAQQANARMWEIADIALPTIDDELALFEESDEEAVITRFAKRSWKACAVKRGSRGPLSPSLSNDAHPRFDAASHVIDTTGAGDSFNGAYLAALLEGQDEVNCLGAGHEMASKVVAVPGAIAPQEH